MQLMKKAQDAISVPVTMIKEQKKRDPQQLADLVSAMPDDVSDFWYKRKTPKATFDPVAIQALGTLATWLAGMAGLMWFIIRCPNFVDVATDPGHFNWLWREVVVVVVMTGALCLVGLVVLYASTMAEQEEAVINRRNVNFIEGQARPATLAAPKPRTIRIEKETAPGQLKLDRFDVPGPLDQLLPAVALAVLVDGRAFSRQGLAVGDDRVMSQSQYNKMLLPFFTAGQVAGQGGRTFDGRALAEKSGRGYTLTTEGKAILTTYLPRG